MRVVRALEVGLLQRPGALLREVQAAEEGLEAGVGAQSLKRGLCIRDRLFLLRFATAP